MKPVYCDLLWARGEWSQYRGGGLYREVGINGNVTIGTLAIRLNREVVSIRGDLIRQVSL